MVTLTRRDFLIGSALGAAALAVTSPQALAQPVRCGCVRLPGGRRVAFAEHGNPAGAKVVIYHHGLPSSRREAEVLLPALASRPDVRLIAFDRPGIGDSDPVARPSFRGWANDLASCADALGVSRFALAGTSGGTPYVLAAALAFPDRVTQIALASPVAEHQRHRDNGGDTWFVRLAHCAPRVAERIMAVGVRRIERNHAAVVGMLQLTPTERRMFDDPANVEFVAGFMLDSVRQGTAGSVAEAGLLPGPWGLPLCRVAVPVVLFHGTVDRTAPPWMSGQLALEIPGAQVRYFPGEGHLGVPYFHAAEILAAATA